MKLYVDDPDVHRVYPITDEDGDDIDFAPVVEIKGLEGEPVAAAWIGDPGPTRDLKVTLAGLPGGMMLFLRLVIDGDNDLDLGHVVLE